MHYTSPMVYLMSCVSDHNLQPPGCEQKGAAEEHTLFSTCTESLENSATLRDLRLQASKISFNTEHARALHAVLDPDKYLKKNCHVWARVRGPGVDFALSTSVPVFCSTCDEEAASGSFGEQRLGTQVSWG